jgi:hypothetical protein
MMDYDVVGPEMHWFGLPGAQWGRTDTIPKEDVICVKISTPTLTKVHCYIAANCVRITIKTCKMMDYDVVGPEMHWFGSPGAQWGWTDTIPKEDVICVKISTPTLTKVHCYIAANCIRITIKTCKMMNCNVFVPWMHWFGSPSAQWGQTDTMNMVWCWWWGVVGWWLHLPLLILKPYPNLLFNLSMKP